MILTIPYVPGAADYEALSKELLKRGPLKPHQLLIVTSSVDIDEAHDFGQTVAGLFSKAVVHGVQHRKNRPAREPLANGLFNAACRQLGSWIYAEDESPIQALFYLDPRAVPARNGWLKDVQTEWFDAGQPDIMGATINDGTPIRRFDGSVVISRAFVKRSALIDFLPPLVHWRAYLRSEMLQNCAITDAWLPKPSGSMFRQTKK